MNSSNKAEMSSFCTTTIVRNSKRSEIKQPALNRSPTWTKKELKKVVTKLTL